MRRQRFGATTAAREDQPNILCLLQLPFGSERSVRTESLTCEEVPEIVGFNGLLVATATCLPVLDFVGSNDAVLGAAWGRLPQHLDALQDNENRDVQLRHTHTHSLWEDVHMQSSKLIVI